VSRSRHFSGAEYEALAATFSALGRRGKTAEAVADAAAAHLHDHHASGAAVELHLSDQLLVPLALAAGPSEFTVARPTPHLTTNAWTIARFGIADVSVKEGTPWRVRIEPTVELAASTRRDVSPAAGAGGA
jgi:RNA 3'-terminal phosphate cyclase (ATP)